MGVDFVFFMAVNVGVCYNVDRYGIGLNPAKHIQKNMISYRRWVFIKGYGWSLGDGKRKDTGADSIKLLAKKQGGLHGKDTCNLYQ